MRHTYHLPDEAEFNLFFKKEPYLPTSCSNIIHFMCKSVWLLILIGGWNWAGRFTMKFKFQSLSRNSLLMEKLSRFFFYFCESSVCIRKLIPDFCRLQQNFAWLRQTLCFQHWWMMCGDMFSSTSQLENGFAMSGYQHCGWNCCRSTGNDKIR